MRKDVVQQQQFAKTAFAPRELRISVAVPLSYLSGFAVSDRRSYERYGPVVVGFSFFGGKQRTAAWTIKTLHYVAYN